MFHCDQLPTELKALIDSYRDKRVTYKHKRFAASPHLLYTCRPVYLVTYHPFVWWSTCTEPGLVVCYGFESCTYYTNRWPNGYVSSYQWM